MVLPIELRSLVDQSVSCLGQVLKRELGTPGFNRIEKIRYEMSKLRSVSTAKAFARLQSLYGQLEKLPKQSQRETAHSFTLMLEIMNACENAYRSHRLQQKNLALPSADLPNAIIYVLTAHPTEARSPQNITIFHAVQNLLLQIVSRYPSGHKVTFTPAEQNALVHLLEVAWRTSIVRNRSPQVKDEADHIYSLLLREEILFSLIAAGEGKVPLYIRSWVGGDKDGHPGVNEKVMLKSLAISRQKIMRIIASQIKEIRRTLELFPSRTLQKSLTRIEDKMHKLKVPRKGDGKSICEFRELLKTFHTEYSSQLGQAHPELERVFQIFHMFPAFVVPLEIRESSDVIMLKTASRSTLPIDRMLQKIADISRGGDPRWYARGFIVSMTQSAEHLIAAAKKEITAFGAIRIPVIPLFEEAGSLAESSSIMTGYLKDSRIRNASKTHWDGKMEMMVGYSDSSKEAGVLPSRLAISEALPRLEKVCERAGLKPIFFHGSGGSIDRGGGSIEDQTAWWPKSALRFYKVTVQGEMVDRSLATPAIAKRQVQKIIENAAKNIVRPRKPVQSTALDEFAEKYLLATVQKSLRRNF